MVLTIFQGKKLSIHLVLFYIVCVAIATLITIVTHWLLSHLRFMNSTLDYLHTVHGLFRVHRSLVTM